MLANFRYARSAPINVETMDAFKTGTSLNYGGPPPLLIAGTSEQALRRARQTADSSQMRIGAALGLDEALDRLAEQASASAIWIEVDQDCGAALERLLDSVDQAVATRRFGAVLSVTSDQLDCVGERIFKGSAEIIVDGDPLERASALALATALSRAPERANDVSKDSGAERLRQLSDEVGRIASTLARLSAASPAPVGQLQKPVGEDVPDVPVETVRSVIRARRLRSQFFAEELFADPAWDMLLDLFQAEIAQLRVPVSSLCIAAAVPATTALRWLKSMTDRRLFVRRPDPHDGRRVFVELSPEASTAMRRYFAAVAPAAVI
jgi:DNA-binding MarR family transcriptional regulator